MTTPKLLAVRPWNFNREWRGEDKPIQHTAHCCQLYRETEKKSIRLFYSHTTCMYVCMYVCTSTYVSPATVKPAWCRGCESPVAVVFHANSETLHSFRSWCSPISERAWPAVLSSCSAVYRRRALLYCMQGAQPQCSQCTRTVTSLHFPSEIPQWLTWARTRVALMGVRRLTALYTARPVGSPQSF